MRTLKVFKLGRLLGLGLCSERGEISSCAYESKIAHEIKFVSLKFCTVFSAVLSGISGFCGAALGAAEAKGRGEVSRGESLRQVREFPLHFD